MLRGLHNYFRGNVRCVVLGVRPERFCNKCVEAEIAFWGLKYIEPNKLELYMSARDYRHIRPVARRSGCSLRLISRDGALYSSRRLRRRVALIMGAVLLSAIIWVMNTFILTVEVTGYSRVPPAVILAAMKAEGVGVGTPIAQVDASKMRNRILLSVPELSWFTVTIRGSHAVVDVRERGETPEIPDTKLPADIVAEKDGIITMLNISRGEVLRPIGAMVKAGETIVSGLIHLRLDEKTMLTHATGDVYARVWHQVTAATPLDGWEKIPTGQKKTRFAICIGNFRINLYKDSGNPFDRYDKIIKRYDMELTDGSRLPAAIIKETYIEYERYKSALDENASAELSAEAVRRRVERMGAGSVVSELGLGAWVRDRVLYVRATGESVQEIGVTVLRE